MPIQLHICFVQLTPAALQVGICPHQDYRGIRWPSRRSFFGCRNYEPHKPGHLLTPIKKISGTWWFHSASTQLISQWLSLNRYIALEKRYTVSKNKTRSWLWLRPWTPYCQRWNNPSANVKFAVGSVCSLIYQCIGTNEYFWDKHYSCTVLMFKVITHKTFTVLTGRWFLGETPMSK